MTVADAVYDVINDNWGGGGYGGAAPSIDITESDVTTDNVKANVIEVRHYTLRESPKPVNDIYTNREYFIDIYISSTTDAAQLKLIVDEVEYLLRNTAMTDLQFVNVTKDYSVTRWERSKHAVILKVELVSLMSSGAITPASTTGYNWHEAMMITSTYAAWVPCVMETLNSLAKTSMSSGIITNTDGTDFYALFRLPLPTVKGTLKLYISNVMVALADADAGDYIDNIWVYGGNNAGGTQLYTDATNMNSVADWNSGDELGAWGAATDCSSYDAITVQIQVVATNAGDLDIAGVLLQCYYAT